MSKTTTIWKSTFREIRESFGRFAAIMAIIALGVGFFAGLTVTQSSMVETTERYLNEMQFYDYRILSTLGFEEEDTEFLRSQPGVRSAQGAVSFDIVYRNVDGNEGVIKTHSLTEGINGVKLLAGRMPETPQECVVDANLFEASAIGQNITISPDNDEEDKEHFAYQEYEIVGIVQASTYIQFERGSTALGDGKVDGFVYLPREGFATEYDTEIYVKFDQNFPLYSEAYDTFLEEKEPVWEALAEEAGINRYDRVLEEARTELADAREELATKKADAEEELAEAEQKLADAEVELADARVQLDDAQTEIADAEITLAEKEVELADAQRTVAEKETELADGRVEYEDGMSQWKDSDRQVAELETAIQQNKAQLAEQQLVLDARAAELSAGEQQLAAGQAQLDQQRQSLNAESAELDELEAYYAMIGEMPEEVAAQIAGGREKIRQGLLRLEAAEAEFSAQRETLEAGRLQLEAGYQRVADYQAQLDAGEAAVTGGRDQLSYAYMELQDAQRKITEGEEALADARVELADGERQLADAREELEEAKVTLAEKETEYADALLEYEDGQREYEDGRRELDEEVADAEAEIADAEEEISELEEPDTYLLGRDTNIGYVLFESDSSIVAGIANIFPAFFFLVAALVCITTMNRMVEEQRTQIGVLKALGYSNGTIMMKYLVYSGSAAVAGAFLGFFGGTWMFPRVIWTAYGMMYRVDTLIYVFDGRLAAISLVVSLLCSAGATWISCRYELLQVAAQLMRPKTPKAGKRVFLEYIPFLWKRLSFLKKVSVRNIFRYKKRLFMMVVGISGCTGLLVTGFGIKDSIANIAIQQFQEIQIYDVSAVTSEVLTPELQDNLETELADGLEQYLKLMEGSMDLVTEDTRKAINMVVVEAGADVTPFVDLHTPEDEPISYPERGQAVISRSLSENLDLQAGDELLLQNEDMETITAVVSAVCENFIYNYVYLNSETYEDGIGREPEYRSLYMNVAEGMEVHTLSATAMGQDEISSVSVNADIMERFTSMMNSLNLIVIVVIFCAAGLAFIVLYNLTNINITERIREIATIKVLGFYKKETCTYVFRENLLLTGLGAIPGLVLGYLLHQLVMNQIHIDMVAFDIHVRPVSYLYSFLLTFVFAWLVNKMMSGKLDRISMTESLKSVD